MAASSRGYVRAEGALVCVCAIGGLVCGLPHLLSSFSCPLSAPSPACALAQVRDENEALKGRCQLIEEARQDGREELTVAKDACAALKEQAVQLKEECEMLQARLEDKETGAEACCALQEALCAAQQESAALKDALAAAREQPVAQPGPPNDAEYARMVRGALELMTERADLLEGELAIARQEAAAHKEREAAALARVVALEEELERAREHVDSQVPALHAAIFKLPLLSLQHAPLGLERHEGGRARPQRRLHILCQRGRHGGLAGPVRAQHGPALARPHAQAEPAHQQLRRHLLLHPTTVRSHRRLVVVEVVVLVVVAVVAGVWATTMVQGQ